MLHGGVELADGCWVPGFFCEAILEGANEITPIRADGAGSWLPADQLFNQPKVSIAVIM